jgi:UDP-GlcNAc:undecaprenyl-phosphate/decaprenyl-phosphate GlcNAc-1-phosphate transferase
MLKYLILFLIASGLSLLLTPIVRLAARRVGALDLPDDRKVHKQPVPRLGGLSIFIAFNLIVLVASQISFFYFAADFLKEMKFAWLLIASAIVLGLGAVDDFRRMPPSVKFSFQIIAGLIVALTIYKIEAINLPFGTIHLGIWSIPVTVFWVVAITNAINLLDGLDGLAAGTSLIVCIAIFGISLLQQNIGIALLSVILAGSILGFLKYNFHPASIFLGDSGAYFLGFILSILSLQGGLKGTTTLAILIPIIALGLPIIDTALSMFRRLLKSLHIMDVDQEKNMVKFFYLDGWSIFKADKDHIHHRLLEIGFTQRKAVTSLYGVSLILGGVAFSSVYFKNINYALLLTSIAVAFYVGIRRLGYSEIQVLSNGVLLPLFDTPVVNRRILRVFADMAIISLSYYLAFLLRFEGDLGQVKNYYLTTLPLVLTTKTIVFHFAGLYRGSGDIPILMIS